MAPASSRELIDLSDREALRRRAPLLAAHRGAVDPGAPENSLAALRRNGALILATVAARRYPAHARRELAQQDIGRLRALDVDVVLTDAPTEICSTEPLAANATPSRSGRRAPHPAAPAAASAPAPLARDPLALPAGGTGPALSPAPRNDRRER